MTKPLEVTVDDNIEQALKTLKKKMAFEGVYKELKKRRYYKKPSVEKKIKREEAERRLRKRQKRIMNRALRNKRR